LDKLPLAGVPKVGEVIVGLVSVLLVSVCVPVSVATVPSIDTPVPETLIPVPAVTTVISADPLKATPWILREVAKVVAVAALPVVFWLSVGNVQLDKLPLAGVPKAGAVSVGLVSVLLVSVCVPFKVTTVESIPTAVPDTLMPVPAVTTVMLLEPSKFTPWICLVVCRVVAVEALPDRAPVKVVAVTPVSPAKEVTVPPKDTEVDPIVTALFAKLALEIAAEPLRLPLVKPVIVFEPAAIVLLVRVSVVALPTKVSVEVGNVIVPELLIDEMTGEVKVLLVSVCVPARVATVESIPTVVPDTVRPVPATIVVMLAVPSNDTP